MHLLTLSLRRLRVKSGTGQNSPKSASGAQTGREDTLYIPVPAARQATARASSQT